MHGVLEIKSIDTACGTALGTHHTDRTWLSAHTAAAQRSLRDEYRNMIPPRMRLVIIAVSCFGSFGGEAQTFFSELGRRVGGGVPHSLLDEASWAVPRFAPFVRMALGCAARRGMAETVGRLWRRSQPALAAPLVVPVPLRPAPPPGAVLPPLAAQVPLPIPGP